MEVSNAALVRIEKIRKHSVSEVVGAATTPTPTTSFTDRS